MSLHSLPELNDKTRVFRDRDEAARRLADMLAAYRGSDALLLGIPTRGLPVAAVMAQALGLPFDVAVVSRICFPWNPEAGFGAVAYDGTVRLHQGLIFDMGLVEPDISRGRDRTLKKVQEWVRLFRGERPFPDLTGRSVILGDEGIHRVVPENYWEDVKEEMQKQFREGRICEGVCLGVRQIGEKLKTYFPVEKDDRNELPDTISEEN